MCKCRVGFSGDGKICNGKEINFYYYLYTCNTALFTWKFLFNSKMHGNKHAKATFLLSLLYGKSCIEHTDVEFLHACSALCIAANNCTTAVHKHVLTKCLCLSRIEPCPKGLKKVHISRGFYARLYGIPKNG